MVRNLASLLDPSKVGQFSNIAKFEERTKLTQGLLDRFMLSAEGIVEGELLSDGLRETLQEQLKIVRNQALEQAVRADVNTNRYVLRVLGEATAMPIIAKEETVDFGDGDKRRVWYFPTGDFYYPDTDRFHQEGQ